MEGGTNSGYLSDMPAARRIPLLKLIAGVAVAVAVLGGAEGLLRVLLGPPPPPH
jgi:hypothetical protein